MLTFLSDLFDTTLCYTLMFLDGFYWFQQTTIEWYHFMKTSLTDYHLEYEKGCFWGFLDTQSFLDSELQGYFDRHPLESPQK